MPDWRATVREHMHLPALRHHRDEGIVEELAGQLEEVYAEALARGASAAEAEAEVERHVADWERLASDVAGAERSRREPLVHRWFDGFEAAARRGGALGRLGAEAARDVLYALRGLRRAPAFTASVVVVLALGIGAATAIFAVVDAFLLKPLPYPEPDRLMTVWTTSERGRRSTTPLSGPNFVDLHDRTTSFAELGVQTLWWVNLSAGSRPERTAACLCTAGLLRALAVPPALGRVFTDREVDDGDKVAVVSDRFWRSRLGGVGDVVGSTITVNGDRFRVVGVMPPGFTTPRPFYTSHRADLWLPVALRGDHAPREMNWLFALGRLAPGVTPAEAEGELGSIAADLTREHPDINAHNDLWLMPLKRRMVQGTTQPLSFLVVGAALLLLIASTNAAGIAFARATARQPLAAIRASLGAGRGRLLRQMVTESLVLSAAGGLAGAFVAWGGVAVLRMAVPATFQRAEGIALDPRALAVALAATAAVGLVVGLALGLAHSRDSLAAVSREGLRTQSRSRARVRLHGAMVATQLALTLVLANDTALMMRSYLNAVRTPLAFDTSGTLTAGITLEGATYRNDAAVRAFRQALLEGVRALPGVEAVGLTSKLPLNGGTNGSVLVGAETFDPDQERPLVEFSYSTGGYFAAMGIPLLQGRTLGPEDEAAGTLGLVVNRTFAERAFPGESALGKPVKEDSRQPRWSGRIVGVVEDVPQWGLERPTLPEIYFPIEAERITSPSLVVATGGSPTATVPAIRDLVATLDPDVPLSSVRTMAEVVAADVHPRRMMTQAIALFAIVAFVLGGLGVYGMVAYEVTRRRHEIGIRMAIGAERGEVIWMVLRQGFRLAAAGVVLGLLASVATSRWLASLLLGVAPLDPLSLTAVVVTISATAAAGTLLPAMRAAAVDPTETLRAE